MARAIVLGMDKNAMRTKRSKRYKLQMKPPLSLLLALVVPSLQVDLSFTIRPTGDPINVWSSVDTWNKCGAIDVPDIPLRIFSTAEGVRIICGSTTVREMTGETITNLTRSCQIIWKKTGDPDPSHFAGNEFLDSTFSFPENDTVVSLIHTEYPGNNFGSNCPLGIYPRCWTVSIGLAVSYDQGHSWQHAATPPNHLVASVPYRYNASHMASGWGDPSNIISLDDGYFYVALWNRNAVGAQAAGTCVARTRALLDPKSWRGWNGTSYSAILGTDPYQSDIVDVSSHICQVTNLPTDCAALSLSWSTYLEAFVSILGCLDRPSFLYSLSSDLIVWSTPVAFYSKDDLPQEMKHRVVAMMYPALVDPLSPTQWGDPSYSNIGQTPLLFWTSLGHSPYTDGRHLWATPLEFSTAVKDEAI